MKKTKMKLNDPFLSQTCMLCALKVYIKSPYSQEGNHMYPHRDNFISLFRFHILKHRLGKGKAQVTDYKLPLATFETLYSLQ